MSDPGDIAERGVSESQFDTTEVGAVDASLLRQFLLGKTPDAAKLPDADGEISNNPVLETQAS